MRVLVAGQQRSNRSGKGGCEEGKTRIFKRAATLTNDVKRTLTESCHEETDIARSKGHREALKVAEKCTRNHRNARNGVKLVWE